MSEILGIGVDVVDRVRVADFTQRSQAFLELAWTERERRECAGRSDRLAVRWAAKEAVVKALGTGFGPVGPLDVEIGVDSRGEWVARLHGDAAAAEEDGARVLLSAAVTRHHVMACAVIVRGPIA